MVLVQYDDVFQAVAPDSPDNSFHVDGDGFRECTRYFSTVDPATSIPSIRSSTTIRTVAGFPILENFVKDIDEH